MKNNAVAKPGHLADLDGIRGLLATAVMLYHFGLNTVIKGLTGGIFEKVAWGLCVDFFFILSGYVLAISLTKRPMEFLPFGRKRIIRLLPVHLAVLLIFAPAIYLHSRPDIVTVLINLPMLHPLFGVPSINGPSWSAGLELVVPAVVVIFWSHFARLAKPVRILFFVFCLCGAAYSQYVFADGLRLDVARAAFGLGLGYTLYSVIEKVPEPRSGLPATLLTYGAFAACIAVMFLADLSAYAALLFAPVSVATIILASRTTSLLSSPLAQWFGSRSYTIYMVHAPVLIAFVVIFSESTLEGNILLKLGLIVVSLVLADLLTRFVELPAMRLGKSKTQLTASTQSAN